MGKGKQAKPLIRSLLKSPREEKRAEAARLLGGFKNDLVAEALIESLDRDPSFVVQRAAARALGGMHQFPYRDVTRQLLDRAVRSLLASLELADVELRRAAAWALGEIGFNSAVRGLAPMLVRREEPARGAAADALMKLTGVSAAQAILAGLQAPEPTIRFVTLRALVRSLGAQRTGWFEPVKTTSRIEVNSEVGLILTGLTGVSRDSNPYVRKAALEALEEVRQALERKRLYSGIDERDDDDFDAPPTLESFTTPLEEERLAAGAIRAATLGETEPRYADLTFFHDSKGQKLASGECLRVGKWYMLEVAVRTCSTGVLPSEQEPRLAIQEPRQADASTLHVTAEGEGVEIEEPVDTLTLPPAGDSTKQAVFRVRPTREGIPARIRVRLYYRFNLLEEVVVSAEVLGKLARVPASVKWKLPITVSQERRQLGYIDLANVQPREMHVDVTRRGEAYLFHFTFYNDVDQRVEMEGAVPLPVADLEDSLATVRALWQGIALSEAFSRGVEATPDEFADMVRRLAQAGHLLWVKLFRLRSGSALSRIGEWLRAHPPRQGALIQVSLERGAGTFVFPWALLYDLPLPKREYELPDLEGFWGIRYRIEQTLPDVIHDTDGLGAAREVLELDVLQWDQFRNIELQNAMIEGLIRDSGGRLKAGRPITVAATGYEYLSAGRGDILYFYAHGYTRHRASDLGAGPDFELFLRYYESLADDSPLRDLYRVLYSELHGGRFEPDRSWIELTYGKLYLDDLYDGVLGFPQRPLVLLNLCESAQVTPSLADSFIHFFLDRGAQAVVGTECSMTIEFAHPFSEFFLRAVLAGDPAGQALLNTRRHFITRRNPLGLAYTLFGQATAGFQPPLLPHHQPEEDHGRLK